MIKKYLFAVNLLFCFGLFAQEKLLTEAEAVKLLENPEETSVIMYFEGEPVFDRYASRNIGEITIEPGNVEKIIADEYITAQSCGIVIVKTDKMTPEATKALKKKMLNSYNSGIGITEMIKLYGRDKYSGTESMYFDINNPLYARYLKEYKPGQPFFIDYPESAEFNFMVAHKYPEKKRVVKVLQAGYIPQ